jgi:hypothetical protein
MFNFAEAGIPSTEPLKKPRISVNKLAEYVEASVARRKTIVQSAKYPPKVNTTRYSVAREIIIKYLSSRNEQVLTDGITLLNNADVSTDFKKNDVANSISVLELVQLMELPELEDIQAEPWEEGNPLIEISGVDVSVNPDLFLSGTIRGRKQIGVLKLSIVKTNPLSVYGQGIVALLSKNFINMVMPEQADLVNRKLCLSFDTFQQRTIACPDAEVARRREVEAACMEISNWWGSL